MFIISFFFSFGLFAFLFDSFGFFRGAKMFENYVKDFWVFRIFVRIFVGYFGTFLNCLDFKKNVRDFTKVTPLLLKYFDNDFSY